MNHLGTTAAKTIALRVSGQVVSIVSGIVITRELGPTAKGLYAYAIGLLVFFSIVSDAAASAASWQWRRKDEPLSVVYGSTLAIGGVFAVATSAILVVIALVIPSQRILCAVAAALIPTIYASASNGFFLALGRVDVTNIQYTIGRVVPAVSAAALLLVHRWQLEVVLAIWIAGQGAAGLYSFFVLSGEVKLRSARLVAAAFIENARFAARVSLVKLMEVLNARVDVFLIIFLLGPSQLGIYSVALGIAELLSQVSRNVALSAYGGIATLSEQDSVQIVQTCTRHVVAISLLFGAAAYAAAPFLVVRLYGEQFASAVPATQILLVGTVAWTCFPVLEVFFTVREGRPNIILLIQTIGTVICAVLTATLVRRFGINGGAIGTAVAYVVATVTLLYLFAKTAHVPLSSLFAYSHSDLLAYKRPVVSFFQVLRRTPETKLQ